MDLDSLGYDALIDLARLSRDTAIVRELARRLHGTKRRFFYAAAEAARRGAPVRLLGAELDKVLKARDRHSVIGRQRIESTCRSFESDRRLQPHFRKRLSRERDPRTARELMWSLIHGAPAAAATVEAILAAIPRFIDDPRFRKEAARALGYATSKKRQRLVAAFLAEADPRIDLGSAPSQSSRVERLPPLRVRSTMRTVFLLYGANGYTGRLIAEAAAVRGTPRPILAGRNADEIKAIAAALGFDHRIAALDDPAALDRALDGVPLVLHAAGPFSRTSKPMIEACLRNKKHYLDITGEIPVFEAIARRDQEARQAGVMLLPGAGFDVVPTDCLAAHLKRRLPGASKLVLAILPIGRASRGTATTALEGIDKGGMVRMQGKLTKVPAGYKTRSFDFGDRVARAVTIPWGDVSTAFHSTAIPEIEVYAAFPPSTQRMLKLLRPIAPILGLAAVQSFLKGRIKAGPAGPTPEQRARGKSVVYGEAEDPSGKKVAARLVGPEGYDLTVLTAMAIVQKVLAGNAPPGFQTPSRAYGADLIMELPGISRVDL